MSNSPKFEVVTILSNKEVHARRDRASLKRFGISFIKAFTSGEQALEFMGKNATDIVLCDESLDDMSGLDVLRAIRSNPELHELPVIMVTTDSHQHTVLDAIRHGVTGYVIRPYSLSTFERHISFAHQMETYQSINEVQLEDAQEMVAIGEVDEAIQAFEDIVQTEDEAQKFYDLGCKYLSRSQFGRAIVAFKKAVKANTLFAEAYQGLAEAYKRKGEPEQTTKFLKKAASIHAEFDRLEKAKSIFIEILKYQSDAPNPFNTLGVKLRKQHDYRGAIHAYEQALELTPAHETILYNMAKCYYFMGQTQQALECTRRALEESSHFPEAARLYFKLTGSEWNAPVEDEPPWVREMREADGALMDTDS
jgi:tetratricopeptide (TPR) repeat protein